MVQLPFQDRTEAGRLLGVELASRNLGHAVVLALPRGGLPVGAEVAEALQAPLDVLVVRKLGVPWQPELAMGAICGNTRVMDTELIRDLGISAQQMEAVATRETREMERREKLYRGGLPALNLRGRTAVLVDDGLATGSTMVAAVRRIRGLRPEKLIVAVPVSSTQACSRLQQEADECVCLARPEPFFSVGQWYVNFDQVTDTTVQEILRLSRSQTKSIS
jgi:putative phosphoribosyl transferase